MIADTMLPGRAGDEEDVVGGQHAVRVVARRALEQPDGPAQVVGVADLDRARVAQGLLEERVGDRRGPGTGARSRPPSRARRAVRGPAPW